MSTNITMQNLQQFVTSNKILISIFFLSPLKILIILIKCSLIKTKIKHAKNDKNAFKIYCKHLSSGLHVSLLGRWHCQDLQGKKYFAKIF